MLIYYKIDIAEVTWGHGYSDLEFTLLASSIRAYSWGFGVKTKCPQAGSRRKRGERSKLYICAQLHKAYYSFHIMEKRKWGKYLLMESWKVSNKSVPSHHIPMALTTVNQLWQKFSLSLPWCDCASVPRTLVPDPEPIQRASPDNTCKSLKHYTSMKIALC